MTKGSPADAGNDEFECILLQSGLCVLGFFCSLPTSSSDAICLQLSSKMDFTPGVCRVGLRQLPTYKGLGENEHLTATSSFQAWFLLCLSTFQITSPQGYCNIHPNPHFLGIHQSFLTLSLAFPVPASDPPRPSGCSCRSLFLSLSCLSSPFCRKPWRLWDAADIRQLWRIFRDASLYLCPSLGSMCRWRWQMTQSSHKAISDRQCGKKMDLCLSGLLCPVCCPSDLFHLCRI